MLRIMLGLLPALALSALTTADAGDGSDDDDQDDGEPDGEPDGDDDDREIEARVQRRLNSILGNEKKKLRQTLAEEIRKELQAEAERERKKEAEQFRPLFEEAQQKLDEAEAEKQSIEEQWRTKLIRSEIKVAAATHNFIKPDVAYKLIDLEAVDFDDDGEPANIEELVKSLAEEHPYLVQSDTDKRRPVEHVRKNGGRETREDIKNRYLAQAGRRPRA